MEDVRKNIDLPTDALIYLQKEAIDEGITIKKYLETVIVKHYKTLKKKKK